MKKIQDVDLRYSALKVTLQRALKSSYRKFQVEGLENIPNDGYTIWAANHTNALMDALVVLSSTPVRKVFVARADIFKKAFVAKLLRFIRIMPIYRIRDGIDAVKTKNDAIIAEATDVLSDQIPFVIFPEATHRAKHSLLGLSKGIFHIANSVMEHTGSDKPVYILPIGIEYGDFFRFRSTVLLNYGKPINITEITRENQDLPQPVLMQKLRHILAESMAAQISFVPDDEDYDSIWEYTKLHANNPEYFSKALKAMEEEKGHKLKGLMRKTAVNQYAIREALALKQEKPEEAKELFLKIDRLRVWRIQNGISVYSIAGTSCKAMTLLKLLLAIIGLPYYLYACIVSLPIWGPIAYIIRGVKDDAFYNTARFAVRAIMSIIMFIVWITLAFVFMKWYAALIFLAFTLPALRYLYDYTEFARRLKSDILWQLKKKRAPQF